MFANVAIEASTYAIRQRHENANRTAASAKNGNRYRSWTRVGTAKNASASTVTPTRIVSRSGRRATATPTTSATAIRSAAPTSPAGNGPICPKASPALTAESGSQSAPPAVAALCPLTGKSDHQLYAFTVRYGYCAAVLKTRRRSAESTNGAVAVTPMTVSPKGADNRTAVRKPTAPVVTIRTHPIG